ncbi:hypothetical protein BIZ37_02020 [Photobacterium sp. BZF1]|uniref:hypothetical protein n=1 Tax=Photobacterium sp. BZF1 TaxID=1904457 RepID=UPI0016534C5F|nr:hypothetical protein [Photobacterium sp. BZF1]MBC7001320.1 hypothetical protein [Photobacterium sp. BZF1]
MTAVRVLLLVSVLFPLRVTASNALPDNEQICLKKMETLLSQQQILFSDSQATPETRRTAERAIDASREAFADHGSYCDAQRALQKFDQDKQSGFHYKQGEVNFFGRGHY